MTSQLLIAFAIEGILMILSFVLLNRKRASPWAGMVVLCLTFCWSVILGCLMTLHGFDFRA